MTKRAPYIPFYPSDWLSGVADLRPAEVGIYINILALIYDSGQPIKADFARLSRRLNCPLVTLRTIVEGLSDAKKLTLVDGLIGNDRAQKELEKRGEKSDLARKSVDAREEKKRKSEGRSPISAQSNERGISEDFTIETMGEDHRTIIERSSNQNQNHIDKDTNVSSSKHARKKSAAFDDFWTRYPNKVGKPVASKAYAKAVARTTHDQILEGLERYIRAKPPDRAWLNPSTFLNQERFNDEHRPITNRQTVPRIGDQAITSLENEYRNRYGVQGARGMADLAEGAAIIDLERSETGAFV